MSGTGLRLLQMSDVQWTAGADDAGVRLDKFLAAEDRLRSRTRVLAALDCGKIFLNGSEAAAADRATRLGIGDVVRVWMDRPGSARPAALAIRILDILYEDDARWCYMAGCSWSAEHEAMPSCRPGRKYLRRAGSGAVDRPRIDRDTSGLVVFAKIAGAGTVEEQSAA